MAKYEGVKKYTAQAREALEKYNYSLFLKSLIAISEANEEEAKALDAHNENQMFELQELNAKQMVALLVFNSVWNAEEEKRRQQNYIDQHREDEDKQSVKADYERTEKRHVYFAANNHFNRKRKEKVDSALAKFNAAVNKEKEELIEEEDAEQKQLAIDSVSQQPILANPVLKNTLGEQTEKAYAEIASYQTKSQKALHYLGVFLAGAISFAFGTIETGIAAVLLLPLLFAAMHLAVPTLAIFVIAFPFVAIATFVNWRVFKTYVPSLLKMIVGRDKVLDGLTTYYQADKSKDNRSFIMIAKELSPQRKAGLAAFAFCAALPTGIAIGALGYTSTLAISSIPLIGGAIVGAGLGTLLPPLGIALAAIVAISITCMLVKNFAQLLQNKNAWEAFTKPIKQVSSVLADKKSSLATKVIVYAITGILALVSVIGLGLACRAATHSIGIMLTNSLAVAPKAATVIASVVGLGSAFIGRVWFTFKSACEASATIFKHTLRNNSDEPDNKKAKLSKKELAFCFLEAGMEAVFYFWGAITNKESKTYAGIVSAATGTRSLGMNIGGADVPDKNTEEAKEKQSISEARVSTLHSALFNTKAPVAKAPIVNDPVLSSASVRGVGMFDRKYTPVESKSFGTSLFSCFRNSTS